MPAKLWPDGKAVAAEDRSEVPADAEASGHRDEEDGGLVAGDHEVGTAARVEAFGDARIELGGAGLQLDLQAVRVTRLGQELFCFRDV